MDLGVDLKCSPRCDETERPYGPAVSNLVRGGHLRDDQSEHAELLARPRAGVTGAPAAAAIGLAAPALADVTLHKGDSSRRSPLARPVALRRNTSRREAERVALSAADGYPITGMRYANAGPTRAHLIVAGATGVPQRFYRRFAEFAAAAGYSTMTLDYRGVGLSAPTTLKGFRMDYFDWGRLDLPPPSMR